MKYGLTDLGGNPRRRRRKSGSRPLLTGALILVCLAFVLGGLLWLRGTREREEQPPAAPRRMPPPAPPPSELARLVFPTDQADLLSGRLEGVFQPTSSGRPESGLYGSVRTDSSGLARLHEGIDIAPTRRDRSGQPLDDVRAAADGRVAYVNRHGGNSSYGIYVVLLHRDAVGEVVTLYAHLAKVEPSLAPGRAVTAGTVLGRMGHTPLGTHFEPHLHFEIGLICNAGYARWFRAQKMTPDHGIYNGQNLLALDPLAVFRAQREQGQAFTLLGHLSATPRAYELVLPVRRLPDFFARYSRLWSGPAWAGGPIVVGFSEGGVPLSGRAATAEEAARVAAGPNAVAVQNVDPAVLGRNGRRIIVSQGRGQWRLGEAAGRRWLEIFRY